jgi:hypothetical protein
LCNRGDSRQARRCEFEDGEQISTRAMRGAVSRLGSCRDQIAPHDENDAAKRTMAVSGARHVRQWRRVHRTVFFVSQISSLLSMMRLRLRLIEDEDEDDKLEMKMTKLMVEKESHENSSPVLSPSPTHSLLVSHHHQNQSPRSHSHTTALWELVLISLSVTWRQILVFP